MRRVRLCGAVVAAGVLATTGCTADSGTPPESQPQPTASDPTTRPHGRDHGAGGPRVGPGASPDVLVGLPPDPSTSSPARLADDVALVERVIADPTLPKSAVRRAAEFEQLAARGLALAADGFTQAVLGKLTGPVAEKTRANVQAARLLGALTAPQPRLPDWRIVEPPPASVLLGYYREAERATGVPWQYLAAVHLVETRMGRIRGVSTAGAHGPMQFLPSTWAEYGAGGDIEDPRDAILAAARLLRANGAPDDMAGALYRYNHADNYVGAVTAYARQMTPTSYRGYWHWRVLYKSVDGTFVLPDGYPKVPARRVQ